METAIGMDVRELAAAKNRLRMGDLDIVVEPQRSRARHRDDARSFLDSGKRERSPVKLLVHPGVGVDSDLRVGHALEGLGPGARSLDQRSFFHRAAAEYPLRAGSDKEARWGIWRAAFGKAHLVWP